MQEGVSLECRFVMERGEERSRHTGTGSARYELVVGGSGSAVNTNTVLLVPVE